MVDLQGELATRIRSIRAIAFAGQARLAPSPPMLKVLAGFLSRRIFDDINKHQIQRCFWRNRQQSPNRVWGEAL